MTTEVKKVTKRNMWTNEVYRIVDYHNAELLNLGTNILICNRINFDFALLCSIVPVNFERKFVKISCFVSLAFRYVRQRCAISRKRFMRDV
ncbi:hypothetical protein T4D_6750 [Trichinella pseudospiralis]|uniref:Uncharacterized protein n=1 Tax=Trichinella pseudospiralis TaxID=6337 RepID=A0A0V1F6Q7_TRIPS|nr:hypothetical protein T4D_6750 [Trichinella pseudospiralis]